MNKFKSKFELNVSKALKKAKIVYDYEPEVVAFLQPEKKRKYTPDFRLQDEKGVCFIETKGKLTAQDRFKMIWVRDQNPDKRFIFLFMNSDVKLRKGSKTTYADWATKSGFEWYDFRRGIPNTWK